MDRGPPLYETVSVLGTGALRTQLAERLRDAYADGLLSEGTFVSRLDLLFSHRLIDQSCVVGDLTTRARDSRWSTAVRELLDGVRDAFAARRAEAPMVLALDWTGAEDQLLIGRHYGCDVVLAGPTVSRRHAQLRFRDGHWILRDLQSRNGTIVNGAAVGRCELRPGDRVVIGDQRLLID